MTNPLQVPDRAGDDLRPLCPWQNPVHERFFAPVDHTQQAFDHFVSKLAERPTHGGPPLLVIACGQEGCGKTSLLHRCVHWLQNQARTQSGRAEVLDLTSEAVPGQATEARLAHYCARLVDKLAVQRLLEDAPQKLLEQKRASPEIAIPFLGDLLEQLNLTLLVVLPKVELAKELQQLASVARRNIVLFTETDDEAVVGGSRPTAQAASPTAVITLRVGTLAVDDGWAFVQSRIGANGGQVPTGPTLAKPTVDKYMDQRIQGRGSTSIRELELICRAVYAEAQSRAATSVEFSDFTEFYLRNGRI